MVSNKDLTGFYYTKIVKSLKYLEYSYHRTLSQLNRAEKLGLIDDANVWMEIRELRNATVHEYSDQDLEKIFEKFRKYAPLLLDLPKKISKENEP